MENVCKLIVQHFRADLQEQVCPTRCPAQLLLLDHALLTTWLTGDSTSALEIASSVRNDSPKLVRY